MCIYRYIYNQGKSNKFIISITKNFLNNLFGNSYNDNFSIGSIVFK